MAAAIIRNKGAGTVYKKNKDTAAAHWRKTPGMLKFTPVKIQPQAKVQFRQKQSIDKIHTVTKAILLQAKYQKPFHTRKLMGISPQFEN